MDAGPFLKSRVRCWLWIIVPGAVVAVAYAGSVALSVHERNRLLYRREVVAALPRISRDLQEAQAVAEPFLLPAEGEGEAFAEWTASLHALAGELGVEVQALTAARGPSPSDDMLLPLSFSLKARGTLPALLVLCTRMHRPDRLTLVPRARFTLAEAGPPSRHDAELVVVVHRLLPAGRAAP